MWKVFQVSSEVRRWVAMLLWSALLGWGGSSASADDLQRFEGCVLIETDWADGDSFQVRLPDGSKEVFRLYFVDCIETLADSTTDQRRLREQARYFGIEDYRLVRDEGLAAKEFTRNALAKPFTLHTSFADARGRSGKPRYYAFVETAEGKDLARILVERGLARAFGVSRENPKGEPREEVEEALRDRELAAAVGKKGVWRHSDPAKIIVLREQEREEMRGLAAVDDALAVAPPSEPVDLNTATLEELITVGLRESLADQAIQHRPYRSVDELETKVKGIGPMTLEKVRPYLKVTPSKS
jgi:endonuclease YncB( thermonuclease family)